MEQIIFLLRLQMQAVLLGIQDTAGPLFLINSAEDCIHHIVQY